MKRLQSLSLQNAKIVLLERVECGNFVAENGMHLENLPPFLRAVVHSEKGRSFVRHEVWLPDSWNGIFVGTGNGGMAGQIYHAALAEQMQKGYAAANTDMGTSRGRESGAGNPDMWMDFGWRATHEMTELAKEIIFAYYGKQPDHSYFVGASTGGEQAFSLAQRFPLDYNGIIAGVPANNRLFLHTYFLWNWRHLRQNGKPLFSDAEIEQIYQNAVSFMQSKGDGEKGDGFVSNPWPDANTVGDFMAYLAAKCPAFSNKQLTALEAVYKGPKNPRTGEQIYCGMPIGSEIFGCGMKDCQGKESPFLFPFIWAFGKDYTAEHFDFDRDLDKASELLSAHVNANSADLSAFQAAGGKMIAFSGGSDPCVPYPDAVKYYNRAAEKAGGYENLASFFRFFLYAGRDHGNTGKGINTIFNNETDKGTLLDALRLWREKGIAPDSTVGARIEGKKTIFLRKVYPYKASGKEGIDFAPSCADCYLNK